MRKNRHLPASFAVARSMLQLGESRGRWLPHTTDQLEVLDVSTTEKGRP